MITASQNLATIQKIHSIQPHPTGDKLSVGKVLSWPVVIGRDQFKDGDLVIFIVIDSLVPETPDFEFLRKQHFRVWNARFRGQPSMGLVMPLSILDNYGNLIKDGNRTYLEISDEIAEKIL